MDDVWRDGGLSVHFSPLKLVTRASDHDNWMRLLPGRFRFWSKDVPGGLTPLRCTLGWICETITPGCIDGAWRKSRMFVVLGPAVERRQRTLNAPSAYYLVKYTENSIGARLSIKLKQKYVVSQNSKIQRCSRPWTRWTSPIYFNPHSYASILQRHIRCLRHCLAVALAFSLMLKCPWKIYIMTPCKFHINIVWLFAIIINSSPRR